MTDLGDKAESEGSIDFDFDAAINDILEKQRNYIRENHETLRKQFGNNYIAIRNQKVVDTDRDKSVLEERMHIRFGQHDIYLISTIDDVVNPGK